MRSSPSSSSWASGGSDRTRSRAVVAMALRRIGAGRLRGGSFGDSPRQGGAFGDDGQDRPQGRSRHRALIRMGWFRPVHCKSLGSQEVRALLVARKQLLGKTARRGAQHSRHFARVRVEDGRCDAQNLRGASARAVVRPDDAGNRRRGNAHGASCSTIEYAKLHKTMLVIVRDDKICRRLMTAPGVGPSWRSRSRRPWMIRRASRNRKRSDRCSD